MKRNLLPAMHILLPNYTNFKNIRAIENLVFAIMLTRENIRLIARSSLDDAVICINTIHSLKINIDRLEVVSFANYF